MMAEAKMFPARRLAKAANKIGKAHEAVLEGVATHVQKEQERRQQAYQKRQQDEQLRPASGTTAT